jgi:hypothetical protein
MMCDIMFWHASDSVKKLCLLCKNSQSSRIKRKFYQLTDCEDFLYCQNAVHKFPWNSGKYIPHCTVSHMERHGNSSVKLLETNCQST